MSSLIGIFFGVLGGNMFVWAHIGGVVLTAKRKKKKFRFKCVWQNMFTFAGGNRIIKNYDCIRIECGTIPRHE